MSRLGVYKNRRDIRFTPSRLDVAFYRAFVSAGRPLARKEIMATVGGSRPGIDHSLKYWMDNGLLKRAFYDKQAWYSWAPKPGARKLVQMLADAQEISDATPVPTPAPAPQPRETSSDPLAQAMRALARLLDAAAERLEKE